MLKKLLLSLFLCLSLSALKAQQGYVNLNDFNTITNGWWPYQESVFWLRGTTPGTVRVISFRGTWQTRIHTDSLVFPALSLVDSANPYKLMWIGEDSIVRAFTPNYLVPADTTGKWLPVGTPIPGAQVNADWNSTSGPSEILNKPGLLRIDTYLGTTDGSGNYTITYPEAFSTVPDVQPQLQAGTPSQVVRITSSTTTGFTVQVTNRASVNLLGFELLLAATTPVSGASVGVLVVER